MPKKNSDPFFRIAFGIFSVIMLIGIISDYQKEDFNPPGTVTDTHHYTIPKSDPSREIHHFDHKQGRYIYMDEMPTYDKVPLRPSQPIKRKREKLMDELIKEIASEVEQNIGMERN
jgi:hypothetical protein